MKGTPPRDPDDPEAEKFSAEAAKEASSADANDVEEIEQADDEAPEDATPDDEASIEGPAPLFGPNLTLALAALSGVVYFLGVPGLDLWPFAFVAQVPLILALHGQAPKRAAAIGLVAGITASATMFYWLFSTLRVFGHFSTPVAGAFVMLLWAYQAGRVALASWLYARAWARGWPAAPVFVLAWVTSEILYPLLFPWYYAISVTSAPVLLQTADLAGPCLVSVVMLGSNLAIAELVLARIERRPFARRLVAGALALPILGVAYGAFRIARVDAIAAASPVIKIGIAQGNQPLVGRNASIATSRKLTVELRDRGADLVVWSEGSVPDVYQEATHQTDLRRRVTARLGVPVIVGGGVFSEVGGRRRELNTAFLAGRDGAIEGRYDKQVLIPFGEYLPLADTFPALHGYLPNAGRLSPGDSFEPMVWDGHPITALICYEDLLPAYVNRLVRRGDPELLVNLTIDSWFGDTLEPVQHLGLARLRAVEHHRYLVRATNSGMSAIVDPVGRVVMHGDLFREEALLGEARLMRPGTLYELIGDAPWYACAFVVGLMALVRRPRRG